ncbi:MAG TPA: hypothetical protein VEL11_14255 [Candidatus Bathyarchaeia archaeon]|nr:hypothetical protein [Candidatus Bathyarchaeia archaeon]
MTVHDPTLLSPFTLLVPYVAFSSSLLITIASISLCSVISIYFLRSYRFSGFGYLLGLPIGFAVLGISFVFEQLSLIYQANSVLYHLFFWIQLAVQSEAFALIALSYMLKNRIGIRTKDSTTYLDPPSLLVHHGASTKAKDLFISILPMVAISIPLTVTMSALLVRPFLNYVELADLSFVMRIFDMIILGYIFKVTTASLVKAANLKLLYIPAAFACLWLAQYSLLITYFDDSSIAFIGSVSARLAGLALFVYAMYNAMFTARRKEIEIETREKT